MHVLVVGGAGFIGGHTAMHHLRRGDRVTVLDNFSRRGTRAMAETLRGIGAGAEIVEADIRRDQDVIDRCVGAAELVYHMAAQVAVTMSVKDPRHDFETNALGTFNLLEGMRKSESRAPFVYASTNKVYGKMSDLAVEERDGRYVYADCPDGVGEGYPLDFHSPYGCSKGTGDQYVHDYHRIYGLNTIVFRQSCIYGTHQFGIEDQGWVAWFAIASAFGKPITIFGDGKQVRDVLYIGDLLAAYDAAVGAIDRTAGQVYNIGGGPGCTLSLLELIAILERELGKKISFEFSEWRPGDQRVYVSDISKASRDFGWGPKMSAEAGVRELLDWAIANRGLIAEVGLI